MKRVSRSFSGFSAKPKIVRRKQSYDFSGLNTRFFFRNNAVLSSMFSSLSAVFPPGEREFVRSVFHFRDQIKDPQLLKDATTFAAQEGEHARQHRRVNDVLQELGYPMNAISDHLENEIKKKAKSTSAEDLLAVTVSLEHITAILADFVLNNQDLLGGMDDSKKELLLWHAIEEIEHKAVAYDVYNEVCGDKKRLNQVYVFITLMFAFRVTSYSIAGLITQRHLPRLDELKDAKEFLFGERGFIPNISELYKDFMRPDFHPWQHDNRQLIEDWKESVAKAA